MIHPEITPFLTAWEQAWSSLKTGASPAERRAHFEIVARAMRMPTPDSVDCEQEIWIESNEGPVRVRVFRHRNAAPQPALIYMHGGAFMQGSPETHWDITARLAAWNEQTVISVDYAKAPERPFPQAFNQCAAVVQYIHTHAKSLAIDNRAIAIGGDSAGANLAAAVALHLRHTPYSLSAQLLIYPAVAFDMSRPSYTENANGPIVKVADMNHVNSMYCPNSADLLDPRAAPLLAATHTNSPPAFIAVAEHDPLRDDGVVYADKLKQDGCKVTLDRGTSLIHGYLRAMPFSPTAVTELQKMATWLQKQNAISQSL